MTTTPDRRPRRVLTAALVAAAGLLAATPALPAAHAARAARPAASPSDGSVASVIVRAPGSGSADAAAAAVRHAGGQVDMPLPIVDGVAATVPAAAVSGLQARGLDVTANDRVMVQSTSSNDNTSTVKSVVLSQIGADRLHAQGTRGQGVTVALVDTGVSSVADLEGRIVGVTSPTDSQAQPCLNLSGESHCDDSYGHGTFLATLIAGNGAASGGAYKGVAPEARIVSLKIAGEDGSSDVSKVIAAIQWAVSMRDQYGIKVLNLSLGTDSRQHYSVDPLNMAVERAWDAGITTVVAAGNLGPGYDTVTKPADDPLVITVGATDDRETPAIDDDRIPRFSGRGGGARGLAKPDVVAPGTKLIGLLPDGSSIDQALDAKGSAPLVGDYRRASGTSMAAAVVSGASALLTQAKPAWGPGQIKTALRTTTRKVSQSDPALVGAGQIDVYNASRLLAPADANVGVVRSVGSGSLHDSRGTLIVTARCYDATQEQVDPNCNRELRGEQAANGRPYDPTLAGTSWYGTSWYGTSWYGTSWYGTSWYGTSWYSTEASQGSGEGGSEAQTVHGVAPPGSLLYGLWR